MKPFVSPFDPWDKLTMWQRIDRLVHHPEIHLEKGKVYPIVHFWACEKLQYANSYTVFREYGPEAEANPYRAKSIDWDGRDFARLDHLVLLEDPVLKITEGVIDTVKFKALYDKARTITIPLILEGVASHAPRRDAGYRVYPFVEVRFGTREIPPLTSAFNWAFELKMFIKKQLKAD